MAQENENRNQALPTSIVTRYYFFQLCMTLTNPKMPKIQKLASLDIRSNCSCFDVSDYLGKLKRVHVAVLPFVRLWMGASLPR